MSIIRGRTQQVKMPPGVARFILNEHLSRLLANPPSNFTRIVAQFKRRLHYIAFLALASSTQKGYTNLITFLRCKVMLLV